MLFRLIIGNFAKQDLEKLGFRTDVWANMDIALLALGNQNDEAAV